MQSVLGHIRGRRRSDWRADAAARHPAQRLAALPSAGRGARGAAHVRRPSINGMTVLVFHSAHSLCSDEPGLLGQRRPAVGVRAAPAALHAAALDPTIAKLKLVGSVTSWVDVVSRPSGKNQLTNVVPFALEYYDLPNLVEAIAPRVVMVVDPVDPTGRLQTAP